MSTLAFDLLVEFFLLRACANNFAGAPLSAALEQFLFLVFPFGAYFQLGLSTF